VLQFVVSNTAQEFHAKEDISALVVTADVPLAAETVAQGVAASDPRSNLLSEVSVSTQNPPVIGSENLR
jgi:uncharacterized protein YaiI (UPF0178 family)